MAQPASGRSEREGLTVIQMLKTFPDDATAEKWFEQQRWPDGRFCPHCGSTNTREERNRKPMPFRCKDCRGHFSVKHGTAMQSSKVGLQKWAIAIYMMAKGIKGTSSTKLYRELGIRQRGFSCSASAKGSWAASTGLSPALWKPTRRRSAAR